LPECAEAVLRDLVADERIDRTYPRPCYDAARRLFSDRDYGVGDLVEALAEKLR
jgi:hypothetical protein